MYKYVYIYMYIYIHIYIYVYTCITVCMQAVTATDFLQMNPPSTNPLRQHSIAHCNVHNIATYIIYTLPVRLTVHPNAAPRKRPLP